MRYIKYLMPYLIYCWMAMENKEFIEKYAKASKLKFSLPTLKEYVEYREFQLRLINTCNKRV